MMTILTMLMLAVVGAPPTLAEWQQIKPLSKPTYSWPAPDDWFDPMKVGTVDYVRVTGSVSVHSEFTWKAQVSSALKIAELAQTARGPTLPPVKLAVLFTPWNTPVAPDSAEAHAQFYRTYQRWLPIKAALAASTYKPGGIVCLVDSEGLDGRTEPARSQVADLYSAYTAFLTAITGCTKVEWYGWAEWPGPCDPDGWCTQKWAVPFDGLETLSVELYGFHEIGLAREATRRARSMADSLGLATVTAWVIAPGAGQVFTFDTTYQHVIWDLGQDTTYTAEVARELYGSWHCGKPQRFMACPAAVIFWPSPYDPRIVKSDPDLKHMMAFLGAAGE
jgi:hypothetical protein